MNGHIIFTPLETTLILPFSLIICKFLYRSLSGFSFQPNINLNFPFRSLLWLLTLKIDKIHPRKSPIPKNTLPVTLTAKIHALIRSQKNAFYKNVKIMIYNTGLHYDLIFHYWLNLFRYIIFYHRPCLFSTPISHREVHTLKYSS